MFPRGWSDFPSHSLDGLTGGPDGRARGQMDRAMFDISPIGWIRLHRMLPDFLQPLLASGIEIEERGAHPDGGVRDAITGKEEDTVMLRDASASA